MYRTEENSRFHIDILAEGVYNLMYTTKNTTNLILKNYIEGKNRKIKEETTMLKCFKNFDAKKTGLFAAGVLFGTAGIKILSSKDAKKLYTNCTAGVLRAKEVVLKTATKVQENAEDIYAEAKQINEDRAAKEEEVFDGEEVTKETTAEETETTEETAEA